MFQDTIERLLQDMVTPKLIAEAEQGIWPEALWKAAEGNGLTLAAAPEELGGVGGSWHDAFVLVRAAGRYAAPIPLAETILVNWLLGLAGLQAIAGPATVALAHGSYENESFSGTLADVAWGRAASHVLSIVDHGGVPQLILLATSNAEILPGANIAREPRDTLRFSGAKPLASVALASPLSADLVTLGGAMIRAAQIAGGLRHLLDLTIDYANQRVQFGRPIGKFQAIQHQIAVLSELTAISASAAEAAFATSGAAPLVLPIASAKSVASEAAGQGAAVAHAVLGAIGFTYEHSLHFTTRRLWSWRSEFGAQTLWAQKLGEAVCHNGAAAFWPSLTAGTLLAG
jgi:acyl-CoA dehydrogenase